MRTTIEMKVEHRARLVALAARRGEKGFSKLVEEALDLYLAALDAEDIRRRDAAESRGALTLMDAAAMRETVTRLRERWR